MIRTFTAALLLAAMPALADHHAEEVPPAVAAIEKAHRTNTFVASGGVTDTDDLDALAQIDCYGVIIGKAIYEGRISLATLRRYQEA